MKEQFKDDVVGIYILPPSFDELSNRLKLRNTDTDIDKRLYDYEQQLQIVEKYDYLIINDNLYKAKKDLDAVLVSECLKTNSMFFSY